jgi:hypothetical protein
VRGHRTVFVRLEQLPRIEAEVGQECVRAYAFALASAGVSLRDDDGFALAVEHRDAQTIATVAVDTSEVVTSELQLVLVCKEVRYRAFAEVEVWQWLEQPLDALDYFGMIGRKMYRFEMASSVVAVVSGPVTARTEEEGRGAKVFVETSVMAPDVAAFVLTVVCSEHLRVKGVARRFRRVSLGDFSTGVGEEARWRILVPGLSDHIAVSGPVEVVERVSLANGDERLELTADTTSPLERVPIQLRSGLVAVEGTV